MTGRSYRPMVGSFLEPMGSEAEQSGRAMSASRGLLKFLQLGWSASPVRVGDRFRKAHDQFGTIWEVMRIWKTVDGLLHVRLRGLDAQGESRIISAVTLADSAYFLPHPASSDMN